MVAIGPVPRVVVEIVVVLRVINVGTGVVVEIDVVPWVTAVDGGDRAAVVAQVTMVICSV